MSCFKVSIMIVALASAFGCSSSSHSGNDGGGAGSGGTGGGAGSGGGFVPTSCDITFGAQPDGGLCPSVANGSCIDGYCLASTPTTCRLSDDGNDGCDEHSICRNGGNGPYCYVAPACPANGICPQPGTNGTGTTLSAACNTGALKGKAMICIPDNCLSDLDCGQNGHCILYRSTDILGHCARQMPTLESDGDGAGWENAPGCEMTPSVLVGKSAAGAQCTDPVQCKPTCCTCGGGSSAVLAAKCAYGPGVPLMGTCASAADACAAVLMGGNKGSCVAP